MSKFPIRRIELETDKWQFGSNEFEDGKIIPFMKLKHIGHKYSFTKWTGTHWKECAATKYGDSTVYTN